MSEGGDSKDDRVIQGGSDRSTNRKREWIANQLRRVYDEALQEAIPDEMMALLAKLDEKPREGEKD